MESALYKPMQVVSSARSLYRHPFTTSWLWMLVVCNGFFGLLNLVFYIYGITFSFITLAFSISAFGMAVGTYWLLHWKKSGLLLILGCVVLDMVVSLAYGNQDMFLHNLLSDFLSLGMLFLVLQIGNEQKPWNNLK
jgi:hypothetical protein